jgi:Tfp pilus assembly protein PilX
MKFTKRSQRGFALILVLLIGVLMMVPVLMLLSAVAPRRATVTGEALSDRALTVADGTVDNILNQVDTFITNYNAKPTSGDYATIQTGLGTIATQYTDPTTAKTVALSYVEGYLLSRINGGTVDPGNATATFTAVNKNVTTYLYNLAQQQYYAVWTGNNTSTDTIAPVVKTGVNGDIKTHYIKNLNTGTFKSSIGLAPWDSTFATDNQWIEIDANAQYIDGGTIATSKVQIRTSAYLLSNSNAGSIVRNIVAEAPLKINAVWGGGGGTASGPFRYALFSGNGFTNSAALTVKSGHMLSNGSIQTDSGQGDVFVGSQLTNSAAMTVDGRVLTSGTSANIHNSGSLSDTGVVYGKTETVPDFRPGTEASVKAVAQAKTGGSSSAISTGTTTTITIDAGTGDTAYYTNGNVALSGSGNTIKLSPLPNLGGSSVDWYINGDFTISGATTIDFGTNTTPGIIWVSGNVSFSAAVTIVGSGTIVADRVISCSAALTATPANKLGLISEATTGNGIAISASAQVDGILYAPHSNIAISAGSTVFGAVCAGGTISNSAGSTIIYDTSLSSGSGTIPPLPGPASVSVSFAARTTYRSLWKEAVSAPVEP